MDKMDLIESFKDTIRLFREDNALREATLAMQADTRLFFPSFEAIHPIRKTDKPNLSVVEDTTFHCALGLLDSGKVAVLNFANAYTPGGDVTRGVMAQEECLCRSSNLYEGLCLPYLLKNYYKFNKRNTGDLGSDAVIYHPGVTVIKSDDELSVPLDEAFRVDVLTCAAPYCNPDRAKPLSREKLEEALSRRIRNILEVAISYSVDCLILGAFGCGAFNNDPEMVAECFRELLIDREYACFFKSVVFAIKRTQENANFAIFSKILTDHRP